MTGWWPELRLVHGCFGTDCALFWLSVMVDL